MKTVLIESDSKVSNYPNITTGLKIKGILEYILQERKLAHSPFSFNFERLFSRPGMIMPSKRVIMSAIVNAGYSVSQSYCNSKVLKTNAPTNFLRAIVTKWAGKDESELKVDFTDNPEIKKILKNKVPRFMPNPEKNWGPKSAARIKKGISHKEPL